MTTKEKVLSVINSLDENATLDEVIDRLYLLRKIELGIAQADAGDVIEHDAFMSELERDRLQHAVDRFYRSPRDLVYSMKPTDKHKQVSIAHGHRRAVVDELIAPLILELWRCGFDTLGSCQEHASGKAYIMFPFQEHGEAVHKILSDAGIESSCEPVALGVRGPLDG
jgi:hypothetical protein